MLKKNLFICLVLLIVVKSELIWKFANNTEIYEPYYCYYHSCIAKCCTSDQFLAYRKKGVFCQSPNNDNLKKAIDFSKINVYDTYDLHALNYSLTSKFTFVYNENFNNNSHYWKSDIKVLEDGSMKMLNQGIFVDKLMYCVDFIRIAGDTPTLKLVSRTLKDDDPYGNMKQIFVASGMLFSCFFLLLVLFVYGLLPTVRGGLGGVILMTYLVALLISFALKATQNIIDADIYTCGILSPVLYYFILCNFFWSNVMSFNMWKKISKPRSAIKSRETIGKLDGHEKIKFAWYCLYAFVVPMLITTIIVIVDQYNWITNIYYKPPFQNCFSDKTAVYVYVIAPVVIMTIVNSIMFVMTAYYVWFVEKNLMNTVEAKTNQARRNRFILYLKIYLLMGVSWLLEIVPPRANLTLFFISGLPNVLSGFIIFLILVCKKSVFTQLCKKFGITSKYFITKQVTFSNTESSTRPQTEDPKYKVNELEESGV